MMTFYHVPHLALGAELAEDYDQRSTLYAFSTFFDIWGGFCADILSSFLPTTEEFNPALLNEEAYFSWSIFAGDTNGFCNFNLQCLGLAQEIPRLRAKVFEPLFQTSEWKTHCEESS